VAVDDPHGVAAGEGEELPDEDADDEVGQIHREAHEADEDEVDKDQEEGMEQGPEETEEGALVPLLEVAADEIGDELVPLEKFPDEPLFP
jgi:hypothetical protein